MLRRFVRLACVVLLLLGGSVAISSAPALADPSTCLRGNGKYYGVSNGTLQFGYVVNNHCGGHFYARITVDGRSTPCEPVGPSYGLFSNHMSDSYYTVSLCSSGPKWAGGSNATGCSQWLARVFSFGEHVYVGRNNCDHAHKFQMVLTNRAAHPKLGCKSIPAHEFGFWASGVSDPAKMERC